MREIFEKENWLELMLQVETELVRALEELDYVPEGTAETVSAASDDVDLEEVIEYENQVHHETMAVVLALSSKAGSAGRYVHLGATSNDILDTATAMQLSQAHRIAESKLRRLLGVLCELARSEEETLCLGRTHGRAAVPMAFGFKFAVYASQVARCLDRLEKARQAACVGKMSGAVGTMAEFGEDGISIQRRVMRRLNLGESEISTQVVPRDRLAEYLLGVCLASSVVETIATEIRNLQRTGIEEVAEPFGTTQVGSSAMPHKRNPILSEKVCGLARHIRSASVGVLENIVLEHERDLTNSSFERTIVPETFLLFDEQLESILKVLSNLEIDREKMMANLEEAGSLIMSENLLLRASLKGADRQKTHRRLSAAATDHVRSGESFEELVSEDEYVQEFLSREEISQALRFGEALGAAAEIIDGVCGRLETTYL